MEGSIDHESERATPTRSNNPSIDRAGSRIVACLELYNLERLNTAHGNTIDWVERMDHREREWRVSFTRTVLGVAISWIIHILR
jgi:hypothetical protein